MLFLGELFLVLFLAFFLAILASFFEVVIVRSAREENFYQGRSKCDHCHQQLAWFDNLPLFSFLLLKGRCRYCHRPIACAYFWVELSAFLYGLIFAVLFQYTTVLQTIELNSLVFYFLLGFVLLFVVIADLQYLIVPDFFIVLLAILAFYWQLLIGRSWLEPCLALIFSSIFFYALAYLAQKILHKEALGLGDIKLMMPLAFLLSWPKILLAIFLAFIVGGFFAMLMLIIGKKKVGQALPFAPFLVVGFLLSWFAGSTIWQWYSGFLF